MVAEKKLEEANAANGNAHQSDPNEPLVGLAWSDITVTATVVGVAANGEYQIYPKTDEKLPHRKGVRAALHIGPKVVGSKVAANKGGPVSMRPHHGASKLGLSQSSRMISKNRVVVPTQQPRKGSNNGLAKNLQCPICQKGFTKNTYLKRHIQSHSGVKPYKCDICGWGESQSEQQVYLVSRYN